MPKPAVVLLSGGLDSSTVVALAQRDGYEVHALSFAYGQRHTVELEAAARVAKAAGITDHKVIDIDLRAFGGSALTDDIDVPKHDAAEEIGAGIPVTYVPARNTIFLSFALAFAEVLGSSDIFIGVNALDYSGYPDCRPEFVAAFQDLARIATKAGVEGSTEVTIHAPLMEMTKAQISTAGTELGVDYAITISCYDADEAGLACGRCDSCHLRHQGFVQAGLADPTRYQPGAEPA
ncbi:7-cyano-7-deazaguanine synthase QueC [Aquihabitans daechungensis]|uniref:7-cyano-7-deazaguanine synthase QueC n=1 Tax=Aquihabitans daechungensis TaxID=1052257 RepID=UPI003B9F059D